MSWVLQRLYRSYIEITGCILGLHRDNGKENGNYYLGFRVITPNNAEANGKGNGT